MRLVPHLAVHDLRAVGVLAPLWLTLVLADTLSVAWGPVGALGGTQGAEALSLVLELARVSGVAILTTLVTQRDPLNDPAAFWRSRPIPRVALWLGKMTSLTLLTAVVPAVTLGAVLWMAGLGGAPALRHAANLGIDHAAVVSVALLAAVPTRSMAHALTAAFGTAVALVLGGVLIDLLRPSDLHLWPEPSGNLVLTSVVCGSFAITALHYLTLRRRLAVSLTASLAAIGLIGLAFGTSSTTTRRDARLEPLQDGAVTIALGPEISWRLVSAGDAEGDRFTTPIRITSDRPDVYYTPVEIQASLRGPASPVAVPVRNAGFEMVAAGPSAHAEDDTPGPDLRALLGVATVTSADGDRPRMRPRLVVPVPSQMRDDVQAAGAHLSATLTLQEHRLSTLAGLAAVPGASVVTPAGRVRVTTVDVRPGEIAVDVQWLGDMPWNLTSVLVAADGGRAVIGAAGRLRARPDGPPDFVRAGMAGWRLSLNVVRERLTFGVPGTAGMRDGATPGTMLVFVQDVESERRPVRLEVDGVGRQP